MPLDGTIPILAKKAPTDRFHFYGSDLLQNDAELCAAIRLCLIGEDQIKVANIIFKHEWKGWKVWKPQPSAVNIVFAFLRADLQSAIFALAFL